MQNKLPSVPEESRIQFSDLSSSHFIEGKIVELPSDESVVIEIFGGGISSPVFRVLKLNDLFIRDSELGARPYMGESLSALRLTKDDHVLLTVTEDGLLTGIVDPTPNSFVKKLGNILPG